MHKIGLFGGICIGIASSINTDGFAFSKNGSIGYYSTGNVYKDGKKVETYDSYKGGDIITMIHNSSDSTLLFSKGSKKLFGTIFKTYKAMQMDIGKKYKMCVYLGGDSSVELIDFQQVKIKICN